MQIVAYLFFGGTAGGVLVLACLTSIFARHSNDNSRRGVAFDIFFSRCVLAGLVLLGAAMLCLLWDLGRPERALNLFFTKRPNVLTVGVVSLSADAIATIALCALAYLSVQVSHHVRRALEVVCAAASLAVIIYTGVYLYSLDAVPFWHTPAIVGLFLFSSLSCGTAVMLLAAWLTADNAQLSGSMASLKRAHLAFVVLEALFIALFLHSTIENPSAARSLELLTSQTMAPVALLGVGGMAIAVPLAAETAGSAIWPRRPIPAADALCLVGGFILRYCVVFCGAH